MNFGVFFTRNNSEETFLFVVCLDQCFCQKMKQQTIEACVDVVPAMKKKLTVIETGPKFSLNDDGTSGS